MLNPRRVSSSHAPTTLHQGHPKTSDCGNQIGCSPRVEEAEQSHLCCRSRSLASIGHVTPPSTDTEETLRQTSLARAVSVCPRDRSRFCHRKLGPLRFVNKILNLNDRHIVLPKASETKNGSTTIKPDITIQRCPAGLEVKMESGGEVMLGILAIEGVKEVFIR